MGDITKATYLLRASQDDMGRWKADAERQHVSFNAHIAACLDSVASIEQRARWRAAADRQQMSLHEWITDTLNYASDPESGSDVLMQSPSSGEATVVGAHRTPRDQDEDTRDKRQAVGEIVVHEREPTKAERGKKPRKANISQVIAETKRPKRARSERCPHGRRPDEYCSRCDE